MHNIACGCARVCREGVDDPRFEGCRGLFLEEARDGDYVVEIVVNGALEELRVDPR